MKSRQKGRRTPAVKSILLGCPCYSIMKDAGKLLIILGILSVVSGLVLLYSGDKLKWLGRLPGDIRIQRDNFRFYAPITTMLLVSVILSLILYIIGKFFK